MNTGLFLLIWFYVYAGLMFARVSVSLGLFGKTHWCAQVALWPVLAVVQVLRDLKVRG